MRPAFEQESNRRMGSVVAGLGNRYRGTYGQLVAGEQGLMEALRRAELERDIYTSGQDLFDKMIGRAGTMQGVVQGAQDTRLKPYTTLGQLLNTANLGTSAYNQALGDIYRTRMSGATGSVQPVQQQPSLFQQMVSGLPSLAAAFAGGG